MAQKRRRLKMAVGEIVRRISVQSLRDRSVINWTKLRRWGAEPGVEGLYFWPGGLIEIWLPDAIETPASIRFVKDGRYHYYVVEQRWTLRRKSFVAIARNLFKRPI